MKQELELYGNSHELYEWVLFLNFLRLIANEKRKMICHLKKISPQQKNPSQKVQILIQWIMMMKKFIFVPLVAGRLSKRD